MNVQTIIEGPQGNVAVGEITIANLNNLKKQVGIMGIEFSRMSKPLLNESAIKVYSYIGRQKSGYTGNGVIIGIVDTGIDLTNPDFLDTLGNTRVISIWDQTEAGSGPFDFGYGTECTSVQINNGDCSQTDTSGHGSHVAGIATGNGKATGNGLTDSVYV